MFLCLRQKLQLEDNRLKLHCIGLSKNSRWPIELWLVPLIPLREELLKPAVAVIMGHYAGRLHSSHSLGVWKKIFLSPASSLSPTLFFSENPGKIQNCHDQPPCMSLGVPSVWGLSLTTLWFSWIWSFCPLSFLLSIMLVLKQVSGLSESL